MKQTLNLGVLSATNIGIAFIFQWYIIFYLGPGHQTDALIAGMTLPQLALAVISSSLSYVLVPIFTGKNNHDLRQDAWDFVYRIGLLFGLLAIIFSVTSSHWVPLLFPGFENTTLLLVTELTKIQLAGMIFTAINGVQIAAYHAQESFIWPEFSVTLTGILSFLILIWLLPKYGVIAAAYTTLGRFVLQAALLSPVMGRPLTPNKNNQSMSLAWRRIKPLIIGTSYYKTDPLIDRFLLSSAASGSLSLFYLVQQIYGAINQVLNKAFVSPLFPLLSKFHKQNEIEKFDKLYRLKLFQILAILMALYFFICVVCVLVIKNWSVNIGSLNSDEIYNLWWILVWLGGVLIGGGAGLLTSSTYYACGNTSTPTRISVASYTLYIPLKVASFYFWDIMGLAIVTSLYYLSNLLLLIVFFDRSKIK